MRRFAIVVATAALAACQTPCPAPQAEAAVKRFTCADGGDIAVTYSQAPETARVDQEGYTPLLLPARISGAGYRYSEGDNELRGRSGEIVWRRAGTLETICREAP